jgi:hypothetical protein
MFTNVIRMCCTFRNKSQCEDGTSDRPHRSCHVAMDKSSSEVFHCDICAKIFLNKTKLIKHIKQHSSPLLK